MTDPSRPPSGHRPVARIGRSHGLEGAMRVHPVGDADAEALQAAPSVWIEGLGEARVVSFGPHGREFLLRVDRVRRVETAKQLVHATVWAPPLASAPEGADDAGLTALIGLPVRLSGRTIGEVVAVEGPALQPLLRMRGPAGETFLPAAAPYVRTGPDGVDVVDPPPGLLDVP